MRAKVHQRPVGQGGLCEGTLRDGHNVLFRWVYDCGSNQTDALSREISQIRGDLDILFLSHLDSDHVNGVDTLLISCPVTEVVLPFLNDEERVLVIAAASAVGKASGSLLSFAEDPASWLLRRGVRRVTFLTGGDDGEGLDPDRPEKPFPSDPRYEDERGRLRWGWTSPEFGRDAGSIRELPVGASFQVLASSGAAWTLVPQVHRANPKLLAAFAGELATRFRACSPATAAHHAATEAGRDALVACYEKIWGDHNLVSMSLFSGPHQVQADAWFADIFMAPNRRVAREARGAAGWISTGDAKLSVNARRKVFQRFYQAHIPKTSVLIAPHHGAASSWHDDVLESFERLKLGCAAAGLNGYGHPNRKVISSFEDRGVRFVTVGEQSLSGVRLEAWI